MHWFGTLLVFGGTILFSGEWLDFNAVAFKSFCYFLYCFYLFNANGIAAAADFDSFMGSEICELRLRGNKKP
jgi:hypothetical protein